MPCAVLAKKVLRMKPFANGRDATANNRLLTPTAQRALLEMKMLFAVGLSFVIKEGSRRKRFFAFLAVKAPCVPIFAQRLNVLIRHCLLAVRALWSKHVEVILLAVSLPIVLVKHAVLKLTSTLAAKEVIGVPDFAQRCDALVRDHAVAVSTSRTKEFSIILCAVREPFMLEKRQAPQLLLAVPTDEAIRMPYSVQRGERRSHDRFVTAWADVVATRRDTAHGRSRRPWRGELRRSWRRRRQRWRGSRGRRTTVANAAARSRRIERRCSVVAAWRTTTGGARRRSAAIGRGRGR